MKLKRIKKELIKRMMIKLKKNKMSNDEIRHKKLQKNIKNKSK
jgi:hypothetical protein